MRHEPKKKRHHLFRLFFIAHKISRNSFNFFFGLLEDGYFLRVRVSKIVFLPSSRPKNVFSICARIVDSMSCGAVDQKLGSLTSRIASKRKYRSLSS